MLKIWNIYRKLPLVAKATLWFFLCSIIQKAVGLITTPIFTRLLTIEQYGLFSTYNSWLSIFMIFTTFKLNYGVFNKGMSKYPNSRDTYVSTMQILTTIFTTFFLIIYLIFHTLINEFTGLPMLIILIMFLQLYFEPAISFWSLKKRYEFKYMSVVIVTILMTLLNTIVGIFAVLIINEKGIARILSYAIIQIIFGLIIYIYNLTKSNHKFYLEQAIFAVKFNLPLLPHYLSEYILDQSDKIMIQKLASKAALGLYSVGYSLGMVMKIVVSSLNSALIPWTYNKLETKEFKILSKYIIIVNLLLASLLITFMLLAPEAMLILASKDYQNAVYVIPPITANVFFVFLFSIYGNIEFFYDQNKFTMYFSFISATLNILLNLVFIKIFGYIAAAYTSLVCYNILCLGHAVFTEHVVKEKTGQYLFNEKLLFIIAIVIDLSTIFASIIYHSIIIRYLSIFFIIVTLYMNKTKLKLLFKAFKNT